MSWIARAALAGLLVPVAEAVAVVTREPDANSRERPVMKVVRMLQDMQQELQSDLEDDRRTHEKLDCWCKTNKKEKTQAVAEAEARISELEAIVGEQKAKGQELQTKQQVAKKGLSDDKAALESARAVRLQEKQDFHGDETRLLSAIQAVDQAIAVLEKHNTDLAQVRTVVRGLQKAKVLSLGPLGALRADLLKSFLQESQPSSGGSFRGYASQSGMIFGILTQMKADFQKSLAQLHEQEKKAAAGFASVKAAKQDQIEVGEKMVGQLSDEFADSSRKHADATQELKDTEAQLAADRKFLRSMEDKCSESDAEFKSRVKSRMDEITAVQDTIQMLNEDKSFDVFDRTVKAASFLQIDEGSPAQLSDGGYASEDLRRRRRAAVLLQRVAALDGPRAAGLSLLAGRLQDPAFGEVTAEIDKMSAMLEAQQKDEADQRDWCRKEMSENARSSAAANDTRGDIETKRADIEQTMLVMEKTIKESKKQIAEIEAQMKEASEIREAENADFQKMAYDQRLAQMVLQKALSRMKQVYVFLEMFQGAPDAGFGNYTKNAGGGRVIAAIEAIIASAKKTEAEAMAAETEDQEVYESFMKESNQGIMGYNEKATNLAAALAKAKQEMAAKKADLQRVADELEGLSAELGDLHGDCDHLLANFDALQKGRSAEIDGLREAKYILSGMQ